MNRPSYKPGTVARITTCAYDGSAIRTGDGSWHIGTRLYADSEIENIRPLVVLDLPKGALAGWHVVLDAFRDAKDVTGYSMTFGGLIDQIEAQTRPAKPDEPGLWAVVEADYKDLPGRCWVHHEEDRWIDDSGVIAYWSDLSNIKVVREGWA